MMGTGRDDVIDHCVWEDIPNWCREFAELYGHYQEGHLYRAGGIEDQPNIYLQAMSVMANAFEKARKKKHESAMARNKAQAKTR